MNYPYHFISKYAFIGFLGLFFIPALSFAQDLETEQVEIIKSFDARLLDAQRESIVPRLPSLDTVTKSQSYNISSRSLNVEYLPPKIRPLAMRRDALQDSYKGYSKLGGGFPASFYIDGSYDVVTNEDLDLGVGLFHHSANNNSSVENQRFAYTKGQATGTYYFDQGFAVRGNLGFTQDNVFFYGYNDVNEDRDSLGQFSFDKADVKQSFSIVDAGVSIFNGERTVADFNYEAGANFYFMEDNYAARETGFDLTLKGTKWFNDAHPLTIELITDFTTFKDTSTTNLNNFFLKPNYTYHSNLFTAKVGANVASSDDEFSFFPDVELGAQFADNIIGAFVGAEGSLQKNNFRNLSDYNPFINSRLNIRNTRYYHFYGGIKGTYQGIDYRAQVGYKTVDDLALFQLTPNSDSIPRFDVLYDTGSIISFEASVIAQLFDGLAIDGNLAIRNFDLDTQEKAWHLPMLTLNVGAAYTTLEDKNLTLRADFYLENGVPYLDENTDTSENLNALFDVSVGAEYKVSERFGFFAQVNNLANNKRQRWRRYPTLGINALAGLIIKFDQQK